jgi:hypothetical protein
MIWKILYNLPLCALIVVAFYVLIRIASVWP